jgi:hypothetical protein
LLEMLARSLGVVSVSRTITLIHPRCKTDSADETLGIRHTVLRPTP